MTGPAARRPLPMILRLILNPMQAGSALRYRSMEGICRACGLGIGLRGSISSLIAVW
jgi:hypothetical protein